MAITKATIKTYFQTGDVPTQSEYEATIDEMMTLSNAETVTATKTFTAKQQFTASDSVHIQGFYIRTSTGASDEHYGQATLVAGTVTVTTGKAGGNDVWLSMKTAGGTPGWWTVTTGPTNFTVTSSSATDTSTFFWEIKKRGSVIS
ncbi:MAG TPA: hypothetical protein PKU71_16260 [bacterium]|nr:hypothetical protein [bacterium]